MLVSFWDRHTVPSLQRSPRSPLPKRTDKSVALYGLHARADRDGLPGRRGPHLRHSFGLGERLAIFAAAAKNAACPASLIGLGFVEPQLLTLTDHPPQGSDWIHEITRDGYRCQRL